jgi:hypothetical protein
MYAACLFCNGRLGRNLSVESFAVGERLAFDVEKGRLWVVCPHCARWNLAALEERWEAIAECERLFRGSRLRVSGENVALAHRPEGLDLIRIGRARHTEVAAWRYGRRLGARRSSGVPGRPAGGVSARDLASAVGALLGSSGAELRGGGAAVRFRLRVRPDTVIGAVDAVGGDRALLRFRHVASAELVRPGADRPWGLAIGHEKGRIELWGREGLATLGRLLAVVNGAGASAEQVRTALQRLENASDPQHYFSRVTALVLRTSWGQNPDASARAPVLGSASGPAERLALHLACRSFWAQGGTGSAGRIPLLRLPLADRLALEMAANEETERRALQGELEDLEAAWRQAEEIAEIADHLLRARAAASSLLSALGALGGPRPAPALRGWASP